MATHSLFPTLFWQVVDDPLTALRPAVSAQGKTLNYRELAQRVKGRIQQMRSDGLRKGDRVALLQNRSVEICTDIVASICGGLSVAVLSRSDSVGLTTYKLHSIDAKCLIVDDDNAEIGKRIAEGMGIRLEILDTNAAVVANIASPEVPEATSEALVIFTSGSTGDPKGVKLSQANIASNYYGVTTIVPISAQDHYLHVMPLGHTNGLLNQILLPLATGAQVTLLSHFDAKSFVAALSDHQPTIFTAVPTMLLRMLAFKIPFHATEKLRFIRAGAAQLLPEVHRRIEAHFATEVIVSYGQTEVTCTNTSNPPKARKIGSIGMVLDGQKLSILKPGSEETLPQGETGEVCLRGASVAMGLIGAAPFDLDLWYRTGDCGYMDEEGYVFLTGRLKEIIIRGGTNLSPRAIENALLGHASVNAASVIGYPDEDLGEVPIAFIEQSGSVLLNMQELNQHVAECLTRAHRLQHLFEFFRLPTNETGKIDAKALRQEAERLLQYRVNPKTSIRCDDPIPLKYIERKALYSSQLGFGKPYEWQHNDDVPFSKLTKPLSECVIAIVTTAAPFQPLKGDQGPGAPYNACAKFYDVYSGKTSTMPDLRISHVAIDRYNTTAEDMGSYFPLAALQQAAATGRIGAVSEYFYGLPTNRSKRTTLDVDCADLLERCQVDGIDAAIFVPNCPVCHQSVALAARTLEAAGIPTVVLGCAKDIVERVGVPRLLFNDFPLGNAAGRPNDPQSQLIVINRAIDLLDQAEQPRTTWQSPLKWIGQENWKSFYSNPDLLSEKQIAELKAEFKGGH